MAEKYVSLMQKLAPDLTEEMGRRALILERIGAMQPVGRRQLAAELRMPEREIRNATGLLKEMGYLESDGAGMSLSPAGAALLEEADAFSRAVSGIPETEAELRRLLPVKDVVIARGDADRDAVALQEVGRRCGRRLRALLRNGDTLAVTGGTTLAAVVRNMQVASPLNVMVVPARGGMGREAELQPNTMASGLAEKLGGHYRLIHMPDNLEESAIRELRKLPEVGEVLDLMQRADFILHGISGSEDSLRDPRLSRKELAMLRENKVCGECFGAYFDFQGKCLLRLSSVGVELGKLNPACRRIAAAAGAGKAEAIISVLRHDPHELLVTDEGAAARMLALLK